VVAGTTAQKYGWRSFWWVCTALSCFALVYQIFFLPETKWPRRRPETIPSGNPQPSNSASDPEIEKTSESRIETLPEEQEINIKLSGSPNRRQFLPFTGFDKEEPILQSIILPFKLFAFPIVQWASFVFSWCASCFLVANLTQSQALSGPPWNLSPAAVGYTNFALFAGASFALLTAGPLSDWISMRATIRNKGIREPEMRLPTLIPFAICTLVGSIVTGIGYQRGWSWEVIVIVGYTLLGIQVASIAAISTTYAVSSALSSSSSAFDWITTDTSHIRSTHINLLQANSLSRLQSTKTYGAMVFPSF
jgi:Major Facilitator Superfamily